MEKYYSTRVGDVSILRLKFQTESQIYNLGVVDNKQSGDDNPINSITYNVTLSRVLRIIFIIIICILIIVAIAPFLPYISKALIWICKIILKCLIFIINIPIRLVKKIKSNIEKQKTIHIDNKRSEL